MVQSASPNEDVDMTQQIQEQRSTARSIIVLGPLGAGKSTVMNIINSQALKEVKKEFVASNSLVGCTQEFSYDTSIFDFVGQVKLIDSPGLADPNILIDVWVNLYNNTIGSTNWKIDLVVCVLEDSGRPSVKEQQLFALLNNAFPGIKPENLLLILNKAPEDTEPQDALNYYNVCCQQIAQQDAKLPTLTENNFLILNRKGGIKRSMKGEQLQKEQQKINDELMLDVMGFVFSNLVKVKEPVIAQVADRKKLAESFLDEESKKEIAAQQRQYDEDKEKFEAQIKASKEEFEQEKMKQEEQEKLNQQAIQYAKDMVASLKQKQGDELNELQLQQQQQQVQLLTEINENQRKVIAKQAEDMQRMREVQQREAQLLLSQGRSPWQAIFTGVKEKCIQAVHFVAHMMEPRSD